MKISGSVRVIKGQEVLPDDSTLEEHGIIDGSTVNIVIEPEKEINLCIKLGPTEFTHKVLSSVRVRELKQQLIDGGCVGFKFKDFGLVVSSDNDYENTHDISLLDESLPLHLCGVGDDTKLRIIGGRITINLVNQKGKSWYKTFPKTTKVEQIKQIILTKYSIFGSAEDKNYIEDLWFFVECSEPYCGATYRELDHEAPIGLKLSDSDVVYFIEDRFFPEEVMVPVNPFYFNGNIGHVGCSVDHTVLSVKLRVQAQFGFPVSGVRVVNNRSVLNNDKTIENGMKYTISVDSQ